MSQVHDSNDKVPRQGNEDDLEHLLLEGISSTSPAPSAKIETLTVDNNEEEDSEKYPETDIHGSLVLFA